jgi:hypothetical protein
MSNPLWEAASEIDDEVDGLRKLVDHAELAYDMGTFQLIRIRLTRVAKRAGDIMIATKGHPGVETDYVISGRAALLPSRQETP